MQRYNRTSLFCSTILLAQWKHIFTECIVDETPTGFDGLYYDPICADGYTCVGVGQIVLNKGELGIIFVTGNILFDT